MPAFQRKIAVIATSIIVLLGDLSATQRTWKTEDVGQGVVSAIAIDGSQNLHLVYVTNEAVLMYAFRPASSTQWFTTPVLHSTHVSHNVFPRIATDKSNQPHVCIAIGTLEYIAFTNGAWTTQEIDPNSGTLSYHCSIAVASNGTPHIIWYHEFFPGGRQFAHARHADLEDGKWIVRSIDGGISGKWNSLVVDSQGMPHVTYSQWAGDGDVRYATWNGKEWDIEALPRTKGEPAYRGYDNSLILDRNGEPRVSFLEEGSLRYACRDKGKWTVEKAGDINASYDFYLGSTALVLDGNDIPHVIYSDVGAVKHAFKDGDKWKSEIIASGALGQYPGVDAVMGPDDTLYVSYADPSDGRVKVAIGTVVSKSQEKAK